MKSVSEVLGCPAAFIGFDENGVSENSFIQRKSDGTTIRRELDGAKELQMRMEQLHGSVDITEQECEEKLAELIKTMKAEIAEMKKAAKNV